MRRSQALILSLLLLTAVAGCGGKSLSTEKVQRAVDQALGWTKKGGTAEVIGVQELPQENAARADIRFSSFQYNADMAGKPISKDQAAPRKPDINSSSFYEDLYKYGTQQTGVKSYSGTGVGTLKHYSDGRWVLASVEFNFVGVNADVEVK